MDRVERYIPPELRPVVEAAGMFNPVQGIMEGMSAAGRGDYGDAAVETVLGASPLVAARLMRAPAKAALAELFGFSGDDLARGIGSVAPSGGSRSRVEGRDVSPDDLQPSEGMTRRSFLGGLGAVTAAGGLAGDLPLDRLARGLGRSRLGGRLGAMSEPLRRARELNERMYPTERLVNALERQISEIERSFNPNGLPVPLDSVSENRILRAQLRGANDQDIAQLREWDEIGEGNRKAIAERDALISEVQGHVDELNASLAPSRAEYNDLIGQYNESRAGIFSDVFGNPDEYIDELSDLSDDDLTTLIDEVSVVASRYGDTGVPLDDEVFFDGLDRLIPRFEEELRSRGMVRDDKLNDPFDNVDFLRTFLE